MKKPLNDDSMYSHFEHVWIPLDEPNDWRHAVKGIVAGTVVGALMFVVSIIILCGLIGG